MTDEAGKVLSDLLGEVYKSVDKMIWFVVLHHKRKYGGDLEELKSVANLAFVEAAHTFDPGIAQLSTHVYNRVRYALLKEAESSRKGGALTRKAHRAKMDDRSIHPDHLQKLDLDTVADKEHFNLNTLCREASEEAGEIIKVALALSTKENPMTLRSLAEVLKESKWTSAQILKAFKELKEAFS